MAETKTKRIRSESIQLAAIMGQKKELAEWLEITSARIQADAYGKLAEANQKEAAKLLDTLGYAKTAPSSSQKKDPPKKGSKLKAKVNPRTGGVLVLLSGYLGELPEGDNFVDVEYKDNQVIVHTKLAK